MTETSGERTRDGPLTLADKLDRLIQANGSPSLEKVAQAILERGGPTISVSYLWLLRTGQKDNPTLRHLEAIAGYFGVPPAYFFDDDLTEQDAVAPERSCWRRCATPPSGPWRSGPTGSRRSGARP